MYLIKIIDEYRSTRNQLSFPITYLQSWTDQSYLIRRHYWTVPTCTFSCSGFVSLLVSFFFRVRVPSHEALINYPIGEFNHGCKFGCRSMGTSLEIGLLFKITCNQIKLTHTVTLLFVYIVKTIRIEWLL